MGGCWQLVFACCLLVQRLSAEDPVKENSTSVANPDEELEKIITQRIASLQEMGPDEISNFTDIALQYYNQQEESLLMPLENTTVTVKKAIGSVLFLLMIMEKTNCTKKDVKQHSLFRNHFDSEEEEPRKYCGPLPEPEQLNCTFQIFKDAKSYSETIMDHNCMPIKIIDKESFIGEDIKSLH